MDESVRSPEGGPTWNELLGRARDSLLSGADAGSLSGPRHEILESWRRSVDERVDESELRTPYDQNVDLSSRLVRAARPVVDRVHEDILGSPITVVLADSRGKVLMRKSGERFLESSLDSVLLAPGFNYAERYVGTNGIGTALEGRVASKVQGPEHFHEKLQSFLCVGVPVRDPVTHRQLGVLDLTTWADRASPALTALVRQAGTVIEEGLLELSGRGARELLAEYLVASRQHDRQVLAISEEAFIGGPAATRLLGGLGRDELWLLVHDALQGKDVAKVPLLSEVGEPLSLRLRAVRRSDGGIAGAIVDVVEQSPPAEVDRKRTARSEPEPSMAGFSPLSIGPGVMLQRLAAARSAVCIVGEPGVGKKSLAESVAQDRFPGRLFVVHHAADAPVTELLASVASDLREAHPVLVKDIQRLAPESLTALLEHAKSEDEDRGWLVLTLGSGQPGAAEAETLLTAAGVPMIVLPPLRNRAQDLRPILPRMVRRLSGGRVTNVTDRAVDRFVREPWPGNLTEVAAQVARLVPNVPGDTLDVEHLPAEFGSRTHRQLSHLELLEREAIVDALRGCGGDKQRAAEALGISRASIYRKIKSYAIASSEL